MTPCTHDLFSTIPLDVFKLNNLDKFYCIEFANSTHYYDMRGIFSEEQFYYFEFTVSVKKNLDKKTLEAFKKRMINTQMKAQLYFTDTAARIDDKDQPIKHFLNSIYLVLDYPYYKRKNFDFKTYDFYTDDNPLFNSKTKFTGITVADFYDFTKYIGDDRYSIDDIKNRPVDWEKISRIYIRASQIKVTYIRVYQKLTEYLAQMSSILSNLLIILYVFVSWLNTLKAQQHVMKKILKFKGNLNSKEIGVIDYIRDKMKRGNNANIFNLIFQYI
jgi:hypothetical protein